MTRRFEPCVRFSTHVLTRTRLDLVAHVERQAKDQSQSWSQLRRGRQAIRWVRRASRTPSDSMGAARPSRTVRTRNHPSPVAAAYAFCSCPKLELRVQPGSAMCSGASNTNGHALWRARRFLLSPESPESCRDRADELRRHPSGLIMALDLANHSVRRGAMGTREADGSLRAHPRKLAIPWSSDAPSPRLAAMRVQLEARQPPGATRSHGRSASSAPKFDPIGPALSRPRRFAAVRARPNLGRRAVEATQSPIRSCPRSETPSNRRANFGRRRLRRHSLRYDRARRARSFHPIVWSLAASSLPTGETATQLGLPP
jgi:hypothetical protein